MDKAYKFLLTDIAGQALPHTSRRASSYIDDLRCEAITSADTSKIASDVVLPERYTNSEIPSAIIQLTYKFIEKP